METESDVVNVYIARKNFELNNVNSENSFDENLTELLTEDTCKELEIDLTKNDAIFIEKKKHNVDVEITWGRKSLEYLPVFTRHETDKHVKNRGKIKGKSIKKTAYRSKFFKQERFISSDTIYTVQNRKFLLVKCLCKASMKKLNRHVTVHINRKISAVDKASCTCPAGKSGYCNHVMALLYELADYSLQSVKVPSERACTS